MCVLALSEVFPGSDVGPGMELETPKLFPLRPPMSLVCLFLPVLGSYTASDGEEYHSDPRTGREVKSTKEHVWRP